MDTSMRDRILEAAEARARLSGYHGFSFREIAADVGIKSASVHYHFPTKGDLAAALVERYTARARSFLGDATALGREGAVARITELFRNALLIDDQMCLCGLFGAERDALPPAPAAATRRFFEMALDFLAPVDPAPAATLARLEGALILARTLGRPEVFEAAVSQ